MNLKKLFPISLAALLLLSACAQSDLAEGKNTEAASENSQATVETIKGTDVFAPHAQVNQEPIPLRVERTGPSEVHVEMTAQVTDIEIDKGLMYKTWNFNGEAPGPVVVVNEGDVINFTLKNMDPAVPHSMDFHAVHAAPSEKFTDVLPNEEGTFTYPANNPGVFMYHCGTPPVLSHIANGMHGTIIVKPKDGYPTDQEVDREFVIIQNEWYNYNDLDDMTFGEPNQVVFSAKALNEGDINTNGTTYSLKDSPLQAKVGEKIRFYLNNVGPNEISSFHVTGTLFDTVYLDGNPKNVLDGMQTVMLPASGGAVVEFTVTEAGTYSMVTHQFDHATMGAVGYIEVTE
ncbi:multicopper oxidase domain-containing protein [Bhargavaea ginsengi]|uniref:multicopper oxidase domain-containing protein n=1 Tax=Bhargavaea ginsengi TaxID=426757 RepID=UPI00203EF0BB|nr:multicopper oxidase domain-containing protein [Bhargavaea ginsengi]MCM3088413.1 multicopper oxidase domain-containing protein [Bhargavaea ginsengi]